MKKYQYLEVTFITDEYADMIFEDIFTKLGNDGYEFVSFLNNETGGIFKKEIIKQDKYQFASVTIKTPMSDEETKEFAQKLEELGNDGWFIGGFFADVVDNEGLMIFWIQRKIVE